MNQQTYEIQYKDYPAMISLIKETEDNGRVGASRYSLSVISEYNRDLNEFIGAINSKLIKDGQMSISLIVRIIKNIRGEYLKRVDESIKLNTIEKNLLKNYIIGKYRKSINPFIGQA
jgi:hypothetical protein